MSTLTSGNFTFTTTGIDGVMLVSTRIYGDHRGSFMETYKRSDFLVGGIDCEFVQDNQSSSTKGVLRGLHFQIDYPQAKLVRVIEGRVFDVAVDLRRGSSTFGCWEGVELSGEGGTQFYIPRGFAHGFYVMSDYATFAYKCDDVYRPNDEGGIMWNDPTIGISWPLVDGVAPTLSEKDLNHPSFIEYRANI